MWLLTVPAILILSVLFSPTSWASVGRVVEQTGPTEIVRNKKSTPSSVNTAVQMNDTVVTARAKARLEFDDKTAVISPNKVKSLSTNLYTIPGPDRASWP